MLHQDILKELAANYGTPLYVIDETELERSMTEISNAFSDFPTHVEIAYPYKSNSLKRLCSLMWQRGKWAEISSGLELDMALQIGVDPGHIIFNGPYKTTQTLERALKLGCRIHFDNFEEIDRADVISRNLSEGPKKVGLRLNSASVSRWDRFGFLVGQESFDALNRITRCPQFKLTSLHYHRSMVMNLKEYQESLTQLFAFASHIIEEYSIQLDYIDIGSGFAIDDPRPLNAGYAVVPTMADYAEVAAEAWQKANFPRSVNMIIEPGTKTVTSCGSMLTRIISVKTRPRGQIAFLDIGYNLLPGVFDQKYTIRSLQESSSDSELTHYTLCGSLCDGLDIISSDIILPTLSADNLLCISNVGSYDLMLSYTWQIARPPIVWVNTHQEYETVRESDTIDYYWQLHR